MSASDVARETEPKVAIVTGAGRGIGRAIALALAKEGYSLCVAARSREQLEETRTMTGLGAERALIVLVDLAAEDAADDLIGAALEHYGRIDVLINNAGWAPARTPLAKMSGADQDRVIAVNLRAPIALARLAIPGMVAQGGGTIVNVASASARLAPAGEAVYAAAKAGLVTFTRALFQEVRESNIKVAVIVPGLVDTELIPQNKRLDRERMLKPEDVASVAMMVVKSAVGACPVEIAIEPQRDPMRQR